MENKSEQINDLKQIRQMMERASVGISLTGLSGIFVGLIALMGGLAYFFYSREMGFLYSEYLQALREQEDFKRFVWIDLTLVLVLATFSSWYFSRSQARKKGIDLWNIPTRRMVLHLLIPMIIGGVLCYLFYLQGDFKYIAGMMLVFYGLGLISAGKFTTYQINYLGIGEIIFGIAALIWVNQSLLFWVLGFGVLHIFYGSIMHYRFEK